MIRHTIAATCLVTAFCLCLPSTALPGGVMSYSPITDEEWSVLLDIVPKSSAQEKVTYLAAMANPRVSDNEKEKITAMYRIGVAEKLVLDDTQKQEYEIRSKPGNAILSQRRMVTFINDVKIKNKPKIDEKVAKYLAAQTASTASRAITPPPSIKPTKPVSRATGATTPADAAGSTSNQAQATPTPAPTSTREAQPRASLGYSYLPNSNTPAWNNYLSDGLREALTSLDKGWAKAWSFYDEQIKKAKDNNATKNEIVKKFLTNLAVVAAKDPKKYTQEFIKKHIRGNLRQDRGVDQDSDFCGVPLNAVKSKQSAIPAAQDYHSAFDQLLHDANTDTGVSQKDGPHIGNPTANMQGLNQKPAAPQGQGGSSSAIPAAGQPVSTTQAPQQIIAPNNYQFSISKNSPIYLACLNSDAAGKLGMGAEPPNPISKFVQDQKSRDLKAGAFGGILGGVIGLMYGMTPLGIAASVAIGAGVFFALSKNSQ